MQFPPIFWTIQMRFYWWQWPTRYARDRSINCWSMTMFHLQLHRIFDLNSLESWMIRQITYSSLSKQWTECDESSASQRICAIWDRLTRCDCQSNPATNVMLSEPVFQYLAHDKLSVSVKLFKQMTLWRYKHHVMLTLLMQGIFAYCWCNLYLYMGE